MTTRAAIVREAREWIDCPYHHQARVKGVGVDCAGLVIGVARGVGIVPAGFDVNGYARQPDGVSLLRHCRQWMVQIDVSEMQEGDVIVTRFETDPCHFAILADYQHGGLSMIHAVRGRGVMEHRLDRTNMARVVAAFALPGVA